MYLSEAVRRLNEASIPAINRYVFTRKSPGDEHLTRIENPVYVDFKKKGVGKHVAIDDAAPGTKRSIYVIKKVTSTEIKLAAA